MQHATPSELKRLALMKYRRDQEREADVAGMDYLVTEGYEPKAMLQVIEMPGETSTQQGGAPPEFLSSHPTPANREEYLAEEIQEQFPNRISFGRTGAAEFRRHVSGEITASSPD